MIEKSGFACSCGKKNEERLEAINRWVDKTILRGGPRPAFRATAMLSALEGYYGAYIKDMFMDQWGVFTAVSERTSREGDDMTIRIQFDVFEDGLALALRTFYKQYGPERKFKEKD